MTAQPPSSSPSRTAELDAAVMRTYGAAARAVRPELCCPVEYDPRYLDAIPPEVVEKDYGCGDPSKHVHAGEVVLDLGSGAGKVCFIAAQRVGASGRVIGVDFGEEMLTLARKHQPAVSAAIGYDNVTFRRGRIDDLALDLDRVDAWVAQHPVIDVAGMDSLHGELERLRRDEPMISDDSVDVVVSNCVLNLVSPARKPQLFAEIFRVLRRNGRAVISDIVCDEEPDEAMKADPGLWAGCVSGAFEESRFLAMFAEAGFHGIEIVERQADPWRVVEGIEFRSMTVVAHKGKHGPCVERNQAVIYRGPFSRVRDDDGHTYERGARVAVCDKTFHLLTGEDSPYRDHFVPVPPRENVPLDGAPAFDCSRNTLRHPRETKGEHFNETRSGDAFCDGPVGCC